MSCFGNEYLDDPANTVALFKKIAAPNPEFASQVYDLAEEALLQGKEYELARKYLGDPSAHFARAKGNFDHGMDYSRKRNSPNAKRATEAIFTGRVLRIIQVLQQTGDHDNAAKIQKDALAVLDSKEIREALK